MNLLKRTTKQLFIQRTLLVEESWITFLCENIFDNIYILNDKDEYLGYVNDYAVKNYYKTGHLSLNTDCFFKEDAPSFHPPDWFADHLEETRLPILRNQKLVGEYSNMSKSGEDGELFYLKNALQYFPFFQKYVVEFCQSMGWNTIVCLGSDQYFQTLTTALSPLTIQRSTESVHDVVFDLKYNSSYRPFFVKTTQEVWSFYEVLTSSMLPLLRRFVEQHNIQCYFFDSPEKQDLKHLFPDEQIALHHAKNIDYVLSMSDYIHKVYENDSFSEKFITDPQYGVSMGSRVVSNGVHRLLLDQQSPYFNAERGIRVTSAVPKQYAHELHLFGPCVTLGYCVTDDKTIPDFLQKKMNQTAQSVAVFNHGIGDGGEFLNDLLTMFHTKVKEGDTLVCIGLFSDITRKMLEKYQLPRLFYGSLFEQEHYWFINHPLHCNGEANEKIATFIHENIGFSQVMLEKERESLLKWAGIALKEDPEALLKHDELLRYKEYLALHRVQTSPQGKIGAIVINANPFTLGHKHLVETALETVAHLYVFVIEESPHALPFYDRFTMVEQGCEEFEQVTVLSGGKIMASIYSFPAYFTNREDNQKVIDPSMHLSIFSQLVCPLLGITHRFFGEEPNDIITQQLNIRAESTLPELGITVTIIPRKKNGADVYISAKEVRSRLAAFEYQDLLDYLPETTLHYLKKYCKYETPKS